MKNENNTAIARVEVFIMAGLLSHGEMAYDPSLAIRRLEAIDKTRVYAVKKSRIAITEPNQRADPLSDLKSTSNVDLRVKYG
jgi:hypothetical protein